MIELFFEDGTSEKVSAPRCLLCGHLTSPCSDWCDELIHTEDDTDLCCDGQCTYAEGAIEEFRTRLAAAERGRKWVRAEETQSALT
jgi:hypothetical protein